MEKDVSSHLNEIGNQIQKIWKECAAAHDLDIHVSGLPALSHFSFNYTDGQAMMTLFVQLMLARGILASNRFYASYAHEQENVDEYKVACDDVFSEIKDAIEKDELDKVLLGPVAQSGFKRLN